MSSIEIGNHTTKGNILLFGVEFSGETIREGENLRFIVTEDTNLAIRAVLEHTPFNSSLEAMDATITNIEEKRNEKSSSGLELTDHQTTI